MNRRLEELQCRQRHLEREVVETRRMIEEEKNRGFVQCQFTGNTRSYTYALPDGYRAEVGEYLVVDSPRTGRQELVQVAYLGRGSWKHGTKVARPIRWQPLMPQSSAGVRIDSCGDRNY